MPVRHYCRCRFAAATDIEAAATRLRRFADAAIRHYAAPLADIYAA